MADDYHTRLNAAKGLNDQVRPSELNERDQRWYGNEQEGMNPLANFFNNLQADLGMSSPPTRGMGGSVAAADVNRINEAAVPQQVIPPAMLEGELTVGPEVPIAPSFPTPPRKPAVPVDGTPKPVNNTSVGEADYSQPIDSPINVLGNGEETENFVGPEMANDQRSGLIRLLDTIGSRLVDPFADGMLRAAATGGNKVSSFLLPNTPEEMTRQAGITDKAEAIARQTEGNVGSMLQTLINRLMTDEQEKRTPF